MKKCDSRTTCSAQLQVTNNSVELSNKSFFFCFKEVERIRHCDTVQNNRQEVTQYVTLTPHITMDEVPSHATHRFVQKAFEAFFFFFFFYHILYVANRWKEQVWKPTGTSLP